MEVNIEDSTISIGPRPEQLEQFNYDDGKMNLVFEHNMRRITISCNKNITVKEALEIYKVKSGIKTDFAFHYQAAQINPKSTELIGNVFKNNCTISVVDIKELEAGQISV